MWLFSVSIYAAVPVQTGTNHRRLVALSFLLFVTCSHLSREGRIMYTLTRVPVLNSNQTGIIRILLPKH